MEMTISKFKIILVCFLLIKANAYAQSDSNLSVQHLLEKSSKTEEIQTAIKENNLHKALTLAKITYETDNKNQEYIYLYAKLLFWNHRTFEAWEIARGLDIHNQDYMDLQNQIREAKSVAALTNAKNNPEVFLKIYKSASEKLRNSYDIKIWYINILMRTKQFKTALSEIRQLSDRYPNSETLQIEARLLFWMESYEESLRIYEKLSSGIKDRRYDAEIEKVKKAIQAKRIATSYLKIKGYLKARETKKAKVEYERLQEDKTEFDKQHADIVCKMNGTHMFGMGALRYYYSDKRYKDLTQYTEFTLPIAKSTLYTRVENVQRYGEEDNRVYGEFYPQLPESYWGYVSFSKTFNADFLSLYSLGMHLYKETGTWQLGGGLVYSKYTNASPVTLNIEYAKYLQDELVWRQVLFFVPKYGSYALLNQLHYQTPCHVDWQLNYIYSHTNEPLEDNVNFMGNKMHKLEIVFEVPLMKNQYSIGGMGSIEKDTILNETIDKRGVSFFFRRYW